LRPGPALLALRPMSAASNSWPLRRSGRPVNASHLRGAQGRTGRSLPHSRVGSLPALPAAAHHRGRVWRGRAKRGGWGWACGAEGRGEPFQGSHVGVRITRTGRS
jgi:hypothetical protein